MTMHYTHIWSYDHALYPSMGIRPSYIVGSSIAMGDNDMHYTQIWAYDHALHPHMVI